MINVLFSFQLFAYFLLSFCCWVLVLMHCDHIECRELVLFSCIFWGLLCALRYDQFWDSSIGCWEKCILYRSWMKYSVDISRSIWCMVWFNFRLSLLIVCVDDLSVCDWGVLTSPTTIVLESICAFKSFSVCLIKLGTLGLVACRLIIVISFWCSSPFISRSILLYLVWLM
jgi:hypothetical protein